MTDNSPTVTATLIGAALGATGGYLFFTDRGRRWRQQMDQALDEVARELGHTRHTLKGIGTRAERCSAKDGSSRNTRPDTLARPIAPFERRGPRGVRVLRREETSG